MQAMEEIEQRLKETSANCIKAFEAWKDGGTDAKKQEELRESVHELRKVASRLEIEMATRERQNSNNNAIPIPSHKSNRKAKGGNGESENILPDHDDMQPKKAASGQRRPRTRRPASKPSE